VIYYITGNSAFSGIRPVDTVEPAYHIADAKIPKKWYQKWCHKNGVRSRKATSMNFSFISLSAYQKWCQVPQSDIDELFIYKFVGPSPFCAKNLYSEYTAWMTAKQ
jgi:hypothetical protein